MMGHQAGLFVTGILLAQPIVADMGTGDDHGAEHRRDLLSRLTQGFLTKDQNRRQHE